MGVAYIKSWIANVIRTVKSRYLVVREEMMIPRPSPMAAMNSKVGKIKRKFQPIWMG